MPDAILISMAIPKVKATFSLDVKTVELLESMAARWQVSKSEALRRAIRLAAGQDYDDAGVRLALLDRVQKQAAITDRKAALLEQEVRKERSASGRKRLKGVVGD
jgi:Tfp pilus assembly protein FimT